MNEVRLIDANALKEDLRQYFTDGVLDGVSARLAFNQILHDIDNAPTVEQEVYITGTDYDFYIRGYKEGRKDFERPQGDCENCDFRKFSEKFIDGVVEVINKNGITSLEQLNKILKGGEKK